MKLSPMGARSFLPGSPALVTSHAGAPDRRRCHRDERWRHGLRGEFVRLDALAETNDSIFFREMASPCRKTTASGVLGN